MKYYVVYYLTDKYDPNKDVVYITDSGKHVQIIFEGDADLDELIKEKITLFETQNEAEEFAAECCRIDGIDADDDYAGIYGVEEIEV
jgi:hypothetical protein